MKFINCNFGRLINADRSMQKSLGGGSLLDIGIYCIQFLLFVLAKEKPEKISAVAHLNKEGLTELITFTHIFFFYSAF